MSANAAGDVAPPGQQASRPWFTLVALALGAATAIIAQTLVLPVLSAIAGEFDVSPTDAIWVLTVNLIAATVFSPLLGRLGDAWGRKRIMVIALVAVFVGSVLAALASEFWLILVGRVLQGTAFGVIALAISIVRDSFPPQKVSLGIALLSAIMGIGGGGGLVLSGLLAEVGSFELIFWASAGASALGILLVIFTVPESSGGGDRSLDIPGTILLALWLSGLLLAIDRGSDWGWGDGRIIGLFVGAAVLLLAWVAVELRARVPLVDMKIFVKPVVLGTNISGMLIGLGMFGAFTVITQFVQTPERLGYGFGADALESGLTLLPMTLGSLIAAPLASVLVTRLGPKLPLSLGGVFAAGAFVALAIWNAEQWYFLVALAVIGIGVGLSMAAMPQMLNLGVPHSQTGIANGMNSTLRELGSSTGSAMVAAILSAQLIEGTPIPSLDGYETTFLVAAGVALLASAAAALIPQRQAMAELERQQEEADALAAVDEPVPAMAATAAEPVNAGVHANGNGHREQELVGVGRHVAAAQRLSGDLSTVGGSGGGSTGGLVRGKVSRPGGSGVRGAALTLIDPSGRQVGRGSTGDDGAYRLQVPTPGTYVLIASASGYQPQANQVQVGSTANTLDVTLTGAASMNGTVTTAGNWPLQGALVTLTSSTGEVADSVVTGDDGAYSFTALSAGLYTLVVSEPRHQPTAQPLEVPEAGETRQDIELAAAASLVGTVRAAATGEGLGDARVSLLDNAGNQVAITETDSAGQYRLPGLSTGEYTVIATGYPPVVDTVHVTGSGACEYDVDLGHATS